MLSLLAKEPFTEYVQEGGKKRRKSSTKKGKGKKGKGTRRKRRRTKKH